MQQIVYYDEDQLDSGTPLLRHVPAPGANLNTDLNGCGAADAFCVNWE